MPTGDTPHGHGSASVNPTSSHGSKEPRIESRTDPRWDDRHQSGAVTHSSSHSTGGTAPVNTPGHGHDHNNPRQPHRSRDADTSQRSSRVTLGSFGSDLANSRIRAEEFSKAVATEVTNCLTNNVTPEELELIIKTRVMSLLSPGSSKKRKNDEAAPDDPGQPNAKRVACQTCSKVVARPCDLKLVVATNFRSHTC